MSGMPASSSAVATSTICWTVIWCRCGCIPSRRHMSWMRTFLPSRFMASFFAPSGGLLGCEDLFGDHLGRAQASGRHDVEVARVLRQEVAEALDLHEDRHALAIEDGPVLELVAGDVLLDLEDHRLDGSDDLVLLGRVLREAVDGVAHHQRRLGRVDDDDGLAALGAADELYAARRRAGELVDVLARAGAR